MQAVQDFSLLLFFFLLQTLWHYLDYEHASQKKKYKDLCAGDEEVDVISCSLT